MVIPIKWIVIILLSYLLFMNVYAFIIIGWDKHKAKNNKWRIPEKKLFITGFIGGALGIYLGMQVFRHKTQHHTFQYGIPLLIIFHVAIILGIFYLLYFKIWRKKEMMKNIPKNGRKKCTIWLLPGPVLLVPHWRGF